MRNTLALIIGIVSSIALFLIIIYTLAFFDIGPSKQLLSVNFDYYSLRKIIKFIIFIIFPIISFFAGFIETFIAKSKEYIIGFISVLPILVMSYNMTLVYLFMTILVVILSMAVGVIAAKYLKEANNNTRSIE